MRSIVFILLYVCPTFLSGQTNSTYPEMPYTTFRTFDIIDNNVIALGTCNQIWHSYDEGKNWTIRDVGISGANVKLIRDGSNDKAIVTAFREVFLYSFENGILESFTEDLNDLGVNDARNLEIADNNVYLLANEGIIKGEIGSYDWAFVYEDTSQTDFVTASSSTEQFIYIGTGNGRIMRHHVLSQNTELMNTLPNRVGHLYMVNDLSGFVTLIGDSKIYATADGWQTHWLVEGLPEAIFPIGFGEDIILTINTNRIYKSEDGGMTSTFINTDNSPFFGLVQYAKFSKEGVLYLSGKGSMFAKSSDYGETWEFINPVLRTDFYVSNVESSGYGYAVGEKNIILKTMDHGETWNLVQTEISGNDHNYYGLAHLSDSKILVAGNEYYNIIENGEILLTEHLSIDGLLYDKKNNQLFGTIFKDGQYAVIKSTDEGLTWREVFVENDLYYQVSQNNNGRIYLPISEGEVAMSDDGGETWIKETMWTDAIQRVHFYDNNNGIILSGQSLLLTSDGGMTFEEVASGYGISAIIMLNPQHILYTASTNDATNLRESVDGGKTWNSIFNNCTPTNHFSVNHNNQLILSQRTGHLNLVNTALSSDINEIVESNDPVNIYPNPVLKGTDLNIHGSPERLTIYSLNGNVMIDVQNPTTIISTTNLSAGVYILSYLDKQTNYTLRFTVIE